MLFFVVAVACCKVFYHLLVVKEMYLSSCFLGRLLLVTSELWGPTGFECILSPFFLYVYPLDTISKLNVHKTFKRRLMYIQFTPVAQGLVTGEKSSCSFFLRHLTKLQKIWSSRIRKKLSMEGNRRKLFR